MQRIVTVILLVGCVALAAGPARAGSAEDAAKAFAAGQTSLAKADFDGALKAFKSAAKKDGKNQEYAQEYTMLRQVVRMRKDCAKERNAEQWLNTAGALRTFYYDHHLYSEALPLDQERHRRQGSAESAIVLAETQLVLGMHSEAVEMLAGLPKEQASPRARVLHGLALARLGQIDEAQKLAAESPQVADDAGPRYFYDLARLGALAGDSTGAFEALTRAFELTPPSQLEAFRIEAKECKDLAAVASSADFAKVLETPSKVKESDCSTGAGCGKCPMRSKCSGNNPQDDKSGA